MRNVVDGADETVNVTPVADRDAAPPTLAVADPLRVDDAAREAETAITMLTPSGITVRSVMFNMVTPG